MKHIVAITLASAHGNFDRIVEFQGQKFRLSQYGTDFDLNLMKNLITKFDGVADVISLSGLPQTIQYKNKKYAHSSTKSLKSQVVHSPVVDGSLIREVYIPWTLREFCKSHRNIFRHQRIGFYSGLFYQNIIDLFLEFDSRPVFADPFFFLKLPYTLGTVKELESFFRYLRPLLARVPLGKPYRRNFDPELFKEDSPLRNFTECRIFVAYATLLDLVHLPHLKDKTLIVDYLNPYMEKKLREVGVHNVVSCMPQIIPGCDISFALLEALFQGLKSDHLPLNADDILEWIDLLQLKPQVHTLNNTQPASAKRHFAFIIHPLSTADFFRHPLLRSLAPWRKNLESTVEKLAALGPGVEYGKITGIKGEFDGQEVEGSIYTVFETPKVLLQSEPEHIYQKLLKVCEQASQKGCDIIGLGAYTKIVGDAGVTVAQYSPIPVTTGNSLSAAATLWAAKLVVKKMGMVERDAEGKFLGTVMVIGATGSIGQVAAKLLAQSWKEVVLVAPRGHKLLELREQILQLAPQAKVMVSTSPNREIAKCHLIITTTSNQGERVLDIMKVRPGCVICDVARPFDVREEDALKRKDVLVVASGEVQLPGEVKLSCDIGLEGSVVYACLAETALLALEGRLESFTISRNISYKKVREIEELSRKHGVKLAAIMGHAGPISETEIDLCREHAKRSLEKGLWDQSE